MVAEDDPGLVTAVNTTGVTNVLSGCAGLRCRPRVVYASSVAVLEEPPGSVYAATKTFAESAAAYYRAQGLEATGVRIGSLYGPGRMTAHVLSDTAQSARDHKTIEYVLRAVEPLVHVDDAARLIVALLSVEHWRRTYCLVQDNIPQAQLADIGLFAVEGVAGGGVAVRG